MATNYYDQFTKVSYSGRQLLKEHFLSEYGIWEIRGEDSNAELSGAHHVPKLAIVEGTLDDAIRYAINLPRFWTWGGGGDLYLLESTESATIKVPVVEGGSSAAAYAKQLLESEIDDPGSLFPDASEVKERLKKAVEEQHELTVGMIRKIRSALEETETEHVTVKFTAVEMKQRDRKVTKVLAEQGYVDITVGVKFQNQIPVTFRVP